MRAEEAARKRVLRYLQKVERQMIEFGSALPGAANRDRTELVITQVQEHDVGWLFFYNTKAYVETGSFFHALGGNGPILVERETGNLYLTGTARKPEFYLEALRRGDLDPVPDC